MPVVSGDWHGEDWPENDSAVCDVCGRQSVKRLLALRQELKAEGLNNLNLINVGGGLTIDYTRYVSRTHSCLVL